MRFDPGRDTLRKRCSAPMGRRGVGASPSSSSSSASSDVVSDRVSCSSSSSGSCISAATDASSDESSDVADGSYSFFNGEDERDPLRKLGVRAGRPALTLMSFFSREGAGTAYNGGVDGASPSTVSVDSFVSPGLCGMSRGELPARCVF